MPVTPADVAIPEEETPVTDVASADEEDTTAEDAKAADELASADEETSSEAPSEGGGDTAIPEGGAPYEGAKLTRVADSASFSRPPPPPLIPYLPNMNASERKLVDHLNTRGMREYELDMKTIDRAMTSKDAWARQEHRLQESRKTREGLQKNSQTFQTLEHQRQEQEAFAKTPEGRFQKEMEGARKQTAMADDALGGGGDADRAGERMLDAGLTYSQDRRGKLREQMPQRGADYDTPADAEGMSNKRDRMSTLDSAYAKNQQFIEQSIKDNKALSDGQRTAMLSAPGVKLNDSQKREFFPIVDRILRNNDTDPAAVTNALHNLVYGSSYGVGGAHSINIKNGELIIGDPKEAAPTRLFISGQDYRTLMEMKSRNVAALNAYLDGLMKKNNTSAK